MEAKARLLQAQTAAVEEERSKGRAAASPRWHMGSHRCTAAGRCMKLARPGQRWRARAPPAAAHQLHRAGSRGSLVLRVLRMGGGRPRGGGSPPMRSHQRDVQHVWVLQGEQGQRLARAVGGRQRVCAVEAVAVAPRLAPGAGGWNKPNGSVEPARRSQPMALQDAASTPLLSSCKQQRAHPSRT